MDWRIDKEHEAALFSHLNKWKHGEEADPDSGAHPLVHLAWRALAIAYQETHAELCQSIREQDIIDRVNEVYTQTAYNH